MPLDLPHTEVLSLLTTTGGHPFEAFGEWDGNVFRLLSYRLPTATAFGSAYPETSVGKFYIHKMTTIA